jgi:hypothetical protein
MDNLGKIGRSLMDNWGGKLGSSLIFYFVAIDDWRLEIHEAETYTHLGHSAPASNKVIRRIFCSTFSTYF